MEDVSEQSRKKVLDEVHLLEELKKFRAQMGDEPSLNPIARMGFELSRHLEGGSIAINDLRALTGRLMDRACVARAKRVREKVGFQNDQTSENNFADMVRASLEATTDAGKAETSFATFKEIWERPRSGIVLTAHPTFSLSKEISEQIVKIACAQQGDPDIEFKALVHRPDENIDLGYEHQCGQETVRNLRDAYVDLLEIFFEITEGHFGERWLDIKPRFTTVASWIGYDLDGRTDIQWFGSFEIRLKEKWNALDDIRTRFISLSGSFEETSEIVRLTRALTGKLDLAMAAVEGQIKAFEDVRTHDLELSRAANLVTRSDSYNMTSTKSFTELFDHLINTLGDASHKRKLAAISSLTESFGLGMSHIHVRINATQLHNAFRAYVNEPWTQDLNERIASVRIAEMIETVTPESVNFGSIELEAATAIRQFAMIAQISKHIDGDTPIRFLIAECETPATILIAVYFAKLFNVSDIIDISPLFETPIGLEIGGRLMERLLQEATYRDYVSQRGRLCIQTGFSDAGRFIGQVAATLGIEWVHLRLADALHEAKLEGVETVIFSTHGESIGRGAYPGDLKARLGYVLSDEARQVFVRYRLPLKHETSFQGGDAFLLFGNGSLSKCALEAIISDGMRPPEGEDPFYTDTNLSLDFFLRLTAFQQNIFAHEGYRATLGAFGTNLLFKTGSRNVKRQLDYFTTADRGDPSRMRAIPNNAILQQLGYLVNVVAGLGAAISSERDRFMSVARDSKRLKSLFGLVARARQLSSLNAMSAYASLFDAGFWTLRAYSGKEEISKGALKRLAKHLLPDTRAESISKLVHHFRLDAIGLHSILEDIGLADGKNPDAERLELDLLHAIRLAVIMHIYLLGAKIPHFSTRNDFSHDQFMSEIFSLDIPDAISVLRETFPSDVKSNQSEEYAEQASYRPRGVDDYMRMEEEIIAPIEKSYDFVREIGTGISHHFGAFG